MNSTKLEIGHTLSNLIRTHHISEAELARQINVPRATINRLVSGRTPDPRASTLSAIAEYFSITVDQLLGKQLSNGYQNAASGTGIPILKWEEALCWEEHTQQSDFSESKEFIMRDPTIQDGRFCLRVKSDAMSPQFQENSILIVDPTKEAANKDFVITYRVKTDEILFRELLIDGKYRFLKAINELFPSIELQNNDKIIGVIIQARNNF